MSYRYSTISDYYTCPTLYKHKHVDGLKEPGLKSTAMAFGTAVHLAMEVLLTAGVDEALEVFNTYWDSLDLTDYEPDRLTKDQLKNNGQVFITRFNRLHRKHFDVVALERRLDGTVGPHKISGTVDLIARYKGIYSVVDFKTAAYRYPPERIMVNDQMPMYCHMDGNKAEQLVYVIFIKHPENPSISVQTRAVTGQDVEKAMNNVGVVIDSINSGMLYKNTKSCIIGSRKCAFFKNCWGSND